MSKDENRIRSKVLNIIRDSGDQPPKRFRLPTAMRIVGGLVFLIIIGTVTLMLPAVTMAEPLTFGQAFFTATSALTVTGLSVINAGVDLSFFGQIVLLILIQFGGVGYMFVASLVMRLIGRRIFILDRLALSSSIGLDTPEAILLILRRVIYGILVIEGIGMIVLYVHWELLGTVETAHPVFMAAFHSISAFCNAGFDLFGDATLYPVGMPKDVGTLIILGALIYLGGLGIPVLSELFTLTKARGFSLHTRITLLVVTILVTVGWLAFFVTEVGPLGVLRDEPLHIQLVESWFHSISSRTAGFAAFNHFDQITPATQVLTMVLMFIGCAPASMGGGITTGTFSVLGITLYNYARGHNDITVWKRTISPATVRRASSVLTISVGLVLLATFLILATHPGTEVGDVLFEVVSAFATCGLSLGFTSSLNGFGQAVIALMMFWGRLGALTIVVAVAQTGQPKGYLIKYPEEQLLIG